MKYTKLIVLINSLKLSLQTFSLLCVPHGRHPRILCRLTGVLDSASFSLKLTMVIWMRNVPYRLICLSGPQSVLLFREAMTPLGGAVLVKEFTGEWALRAYSLLPIPVTFLSTSCVWTEMWWASFLLSVPCLPCHDRFYPSGTISQSKLSLPQDASHLGVRSQQQKSNRQTYWHYIKKGCCGWKESQKCNHYMKPQ